jgi:hypothetical protein
MTPIPWLRQQRATVGVRTSARGKRRGDPALEETSQRACMVEHRRYCRACFCAGGQAYRREGAIPSPQSPKTARQSLPCARRSAPVRARMYLSPTTMCMRSGGVPPVLENEGRVRARHGAGTQFPGRVSNAPRAERHEKNVLMIACTPQSMLPGGGQCGGQPLHGQQREAGVA